MQIRLLPALKTGAEADEASGAITPAKAFFVLPAPSSFSLQVYSGANMNEPSSSSLTVRVWLFGVLVLVLVRLNSDDLSPTKDLFTFRRCPLGRAGEAPTPLSSAPVSPADCSADPLWQLLQRYA